jgi:large conductance mechanosensitive channel
MTKSLSTLWAEFKTFAFKGNLIDLAVAVVLGAAFGAVINSLVKNIVMPLVSYVIPTEGGYRAWHIGRIEVGVFLGELLNFTIVALAIFLVMVKVLGAIMKKSGPPPDPAAPTTKECPFCLSTIPLRAVRCGHCTSDLTPAGDGRITAATA